MPNRICGCGAVYDKASTGTSRCPRCQTQADRHQAARRARAAALRPSSSARGYDAEYRRNRVLIIAHALAAADTGHPVQCALCPLPCLRGENLTAEHITALRDGGTSDIANLAPAHAACNTAWNKNRTSA